MTHCERRVTCSLAERWLAKVIEQSCRLRDRVEQSLVQRLVGIVNMLRMVVCDGNSVMGESRGILSVV